MEEPTGCWLVKPRNAIPRFVVVSGAGKVLRFAEFDELADKQIEPPVIIVIEPQRARCPSGSRHASLFRNVGEGPVAVVVIQNASSILRDIHVRETVAVVVAYCNALPVSLARNSRLFCDISESPVAIIAIHRVPQRGIRIIKVTFAAIDEVDVHPSVIIVVQKRAACTGGFRQVFLGRFPGRVYPSDPAGGG